MVVSLLDLEAAVSNLRYKLIGYRSEDKDVHVEIRMIEADPGSGVMIDALMLRANRPDEHELKTQQSIVIEVFNANEGQKPTASFIESFKIDSKY